MLEGQQRNYTSGMTKLLIDLDNDQRGFIQVLAWSPFQKFLTQNSTYFLHSF